MPKTFRASTTKQHEEGKIGAVILGAAFWELGKTVKGIYIRSWMSANGEMYDFLSMTPFDVMVDDAGKVVKTGGTVKQADRFTMGALKGWQMALQELAYAGFQLPFQYNQKVAIKCDKIAPWRDGDSDAGFSDMVYFTVEVEE